MGTYKYTLKKFFKDWMLVICMMAGASLYVLYHNLEFLHPAGPVLETVCKRIQPVCLFMMLFLSFCKIEPHQMRPHKWQWWLLLVQGGVFVLVALGIVLAAGSSSGLSGLITGNRLPLEAFMLCMITPTATACAVVTGKLGGNMAGVVTYTVLINILVAVLVPLMVPLLYPTSGTTFMDAFARILGKVFPLLIMPCVSAWIVRYLFPGLHKWLLSRVELSFYIWAFSLMLAILMSTRAIYHYQGRAFVLLEIALASLIGCAIQFYLGKQIGARYGCRISGGQAMGQKNTVFAIWVGYTFFNPIISVTGGFYSIWHNCFNTWQLYRRRKQLEAGG